MKRTTLVRLGRRVLELATVCLVLSASLIPAASASQPQVARAPVAEREVTFTVVNSNTSGVPCPSDDSTYEVHGALTGPWSAFRAGRPVAVSLYLHGFSLGGAFLWSFKAVDGYDWPVEMAELGHVSVSIDRLGYEASGHPHGVLTCLGSGADVVHQIVQALRTGSYTVADGHPVAFDKVVLVGHDTGGAVAEISAYSYGDIDGLVVWGWADQGFSPWVLERFPERMAFCARGGEEAESDTPGGGYFHWPTSEQEVRDGIRERMEPDVLDAAVAMRNRNPCGDLATAATASNLHERGGRLGEIDVPVLLIYADNDIIFTHEGAQEQQAHFTGTDDLTWVMLEDAGHFPMLERRAEEYRQLVSDWLTTRSFRAHPPQIDRRP